MNDPTNPPPIHAYTRADALADKALIDVSEAAREAGFHVPVAVTAAVFHDCIEWTPADSDRKRGARDENARRWDLVNSAVQAVRRHANSDAGAVDFVHYRVPRQGKTTKPRRVDLRLTIHGGDDGRPVVTIMAPEED